tara:strand:+ start:53 stop:1570 length:1518 start_codon:yes stop_codon:yes gene_type:complete
MISSKKHSFIQAYKDGQNFIPVYESWPADLETPLTTWLKLSKENSHGVFLESVEGGENIGRWSIVANNPLWEAVCHGEETVRTFRNGRKDVKKGDVFNSLRSWTQEYKSHSLEEFPFLGQLYGSWGFELINFIESSVPIHKINKEQIPYGSWMFFDQIIVFDQMKRCLTALIYADTNQLQNIPIEEIYERSIKQIEEIKNLMKIPLKNVDILKWQQKKDLNLEISSNWSKDNFQKAVVQAKEFIQKGDIFQIVISQRFKTQVKNKPFDLYRSLRMINPSPYMAFFDFGSWFLIGSSPEVMVKAERRNNNQILASLRPIAGTRPRGKDIHEDSLFESDLLNDPKEISEHVMLVDLGRNDLGRVCEIGSIQVKDLMTIEKYSHVMHIVSEVQGILESDKDVWDLLKASFPAGTVTGAPKIRAMQLIQSFEKEARGPYAGIYGSVDINGALNTAITIRSMVAVPNTKGELDVFIQAGAGVVADSSPINEYNETVNKAKGILMAISSLD